ncbi:hypothetical protein SAMN05660464_1964 [Geodermatophilus dictyosporus]|uniref:Homeodomain-like domain-containing protein n=1 Tax=Geodermatophilus dictyosporus TaxID=1523247 RepID=A0A1I5LWJ5_9ACTN|nr:hypothetical protein [Geodermatophilus dictyosporus]SFP01612.1 hypothetical protein SAMN05660464_1964 [Geodermatophilus dictyosporus]
MEAASVAGPVEDVGTGSAEAAPHRAATDPGEDTAVQALEELVREIDRCAAELQGARARAEVLLADRRAGHSWLELVTQESRPLVVERITTVLSALSGAGSAWRRAQARALQEERVSINRIAAMYGVTRQRISALLREGAPAERSDAG